MAKARSKLPSYRHHKASGQACVKLSGRTIYLGPHGTRLSRDNYDRVVSEWLAAGRTFPRDEDSRVLSVAEMVLGFRNSGAVPESQAHSYKAVMQLLVRLYGATAAHDFGPLALRAVREQMIAQGWNRKTINTRVYLLRRIFKWAAGHQLLPAAVHDALRAVEGLELNRTTAPEPEAVDPVAVEHVEACLPFLSPTIQTMVRLQLLTGMRPGEVIQIRTCDLDMSDPKCWIYRLAKHKTAHRGKKREIAIGPKAIDILRPWLKSDLQAYIFSPAEAERARRERLTAQRRTPASAGNRVGNNRTTDPERAPGDQYTVPSYRRAIYRSCELAFPLPPAIGPRAGESTAAWEARLTAIDRVEIAKWRSEHSWHPHQLRHTFATLVRKQFGLDHAQKALGHAHAAVTETYASVALEKAVEVAKAIG